MKNFYFTAKILLLSLAFFSLQANAQAPQTITYQSVIRNSSNVLLANTAVGIKISILQGSSIGTEAYAETQTATTNTNGLVSLQIGTGTPTTDTTFAGIDWAAGPYFIKTETDPTGGSNYTITGIQQMASVPYALYAAKSGGTVFEPTIDMPDAIHNTNQGNVGIGTDLPGEKLDVAGNLKVRGNISNGESNASGAFSIATGQNSTASGPYSTAMGDASIANGYSTTALGIASTASGWGATAIGIQSSAEGSASVALGSRAKAYSLSEIAVGQFNTAYTLNTSNSSYEFNGADRIFVVGNGIDENNKSDAMVVLKNGNTTINGTTTANSFVKAGGQANEFLMADGSVSTGGASPDLTGYATITDVTNLQSTVINNQIQSDNLLAQTQDLNNEIYDLEAQIATMQAQIAALIGSSPTLTIGQSYQGGKIFWLDATGQHGLIAATEDQSTGVIWSNEDFPYRDLGTSDGLYSGELNTTIAVATLGAAAGQPSLNFYGKSLRPLFCYRRWYYLWRLVSAILI